MSELDVHHIICPAIKSERDQLRAEIRQAQDHVLELRLRISTHEPEAPDPYDGNGWHEYLHP